MNLKDIEDFTAYLSKVRQAFADYRRSEGCSCCRDGEKHSEALERLANLLDVPAYPDNSGFDFGPFETKK